MNLAASAINIYNHCVHDNGMYVFDSDSSTLVFYNSTKVHICNDQTVIIKNFDMGPIQKF